MAGFGFASLAAVVGIGAALIALIIGADQSSFELWPSLVPYLQLTVRLDPLGAFFVLLVSVLGVGAVGLFLRLRPRLLRAEECRRPGRLL